MVMRVPAKIGLVLSGGSLKAAAHIGAIEALAELGIHPHMVAGTSAGALVTALYAHGYDYCAMNELVATFPGRKILDYSFPFWHRFLHLLPERIVDKSAAAIPNGLFAGDKLTQYIAEKLDGRTASLPYFIVSTDLVSGRPVVFTNHTPSIQRGSAVAVQDVPRSIVASCALPGIFRPVHIGSCILVDGAIRHYAPVHVLRQAGCDRMIVVNLHVLRPHWQPESVVDVLTRSFEVMLRETIEDDTAGPDVAVIEPDVSHVKWTSFGELKNCVRAGYTSVMHPRVQAKLDALMNRNTGAHRSSPAIRINGQSG